VVNTEIQIDVCDLNGRLVYSENRIYREADFLDLSKIDAGLYIINVSGKDFKQHYKIIKN